MNGDSDPIKNTLVLGASLNEFRYSNTCVKLLFKKGIPVTAVGLKKGCIGQIQILTTVPDSGTFHTITLYLGKNNQRPYYPNILSLNPSRVIFNPGTENDELKELLKEKGIEVIEACTIMMLEWGTF